MSKTPRPYVLLAHAGHGVNSYAFHYYLVHRPLMLFLQVGWGGVYGDRALETEVVNECFRLCHELVSCVDEAVKRRALGIGTAVPVVASDFSRSKSRNVYPPGSLGMTGWPLRGQHGGDWNGPTPQEVLSEAASWFRSLPDPKEAKQETRMPTKRVLDELEQQSIREQLEDGLPREIVAAETGATLKQVDAIKAHMTIRARRKRLSDEEMLQRALKYARARARAKGLRCLDFSECRDLWEEQGARCAISGRRFSDRQVNNKAKVLSRPWRPSVDRISPNRGYERQNVRLVAQIVNFAINEWPLQIFRDMCKRVVEYQASLRGSSRPRTA